MISYYYNYNFVSPEGIYSLVKEELKSYFDTGAIDDALFPLYTDKCLKKLQKGVLPIEQTLMAVEDFKSKLPDDFDSVREAWLCSHNNVPYQLPAAHYEQVSKGCTSTRIDSPDLSCGVCDSCTFPDIIQAVYKTTKQVVFSFRKMHLLRPGNANVQKFLGPNCANTSWCDSPDTFDIRDNKFVVNFKTGIVHLIYYAKQYDEDGFQLIPDNVRIQEYIEVYIKYKMFEQLYNQVTDETYNQIRDKYENYKAEQFEKQVLAEIEMKKQTVDQKHQASLRTMSRNSRYEIR